MQAGYTRHPLIPAICCRTMQHKHIVGYIGGHIDCDANVMYIFLEYVPGGSIARMLERFGRFTEELVRNYTRQLLLGLEYLHGCKVGPAARRYGQPVG